MQLVNVNERLLALILKFQDESKTIQFGLFSDFSAFKAGGIGVIPMNKGGRRSVN